MRKHFSKIVACVLSATLVISPFANVAYGDDMVTGGGVTDEVLTQCHLDKIYFVFF